MQDTMIELDGHSLITPEAIAAVLPVEGAEIQDLSSAWLALESRLDRAAADFEAGSEPGVVTESLLLDLHVRRMELAPPVWTALVPRIRSHPVADFLYQDPITDWSNRKPRGYSGDAHLLDLIAGHADIRSQVEGATPLGRAIYSYTSSTPCSRANTDRLEILARLVDLAADAHGPGTTTMSIAAGHLREAERSLAFKEGLLGRWVALDQDPVSVATVERAWSGTCVESVKGSVRDILSGKKDFGTYHHVYSSGLYDYLTEKVAIKLTRKALDLVLPGGTFLFANYARPTVEDAYMETFMNWALILRTEDEVLDIAKKAAADIDAEVTVFSGSNRTIVYGLITKRRG